MGSLGQKHLFLVLICKIVESFSTKDSSEVAVEREKNEMRDMKGISLKKGLEIELYWSAIKLTHGVSGNSCECPEDKFEEACSQL